MHNNKCSIKTSRRFKTCKTIRTFKKYKNIHGREGNGVQEEHTGRLKTNT